MKEKKHIITNLLAPDLRQDSVSKKYTLESIFNNLDEIEFPSSDMIFISNEGTKEKIKERVRDILYKSYFNDPCLSVVLLSTFDGIPEGILALTGSKVEESYCAETKILGTTNNKFSEVRHALFSSAVQWASLCGYEKVTYGCKEKQEINVKDIEKDISDSFHNFNFKTDWNIKQIIMDKINKIELLDGGKFFPDCYRFIMESERVLDLMPSLEYNLDKYEPGHIIKIGLNGSKQPAYAKHPGVPLYLKNISLELD